MLRHITHAISPDLSNDTSSRHGEVFDPSTGAVSANVDLASADLVGRIVERAMSAGHDWGALSITRRTQVLFRFRDLVDRHRQELADLVTSEHGKVTEDALGEVARGLEVIEFACGIPHLLKGEHSENVSTGVDIYSVTHPVGVVGVIAPFNFPVMVPLWFVPIAIACGNAVVLKPSERVPSAANALARLWREAGLPDGVLSVVHGDKEAVNALLAHPSVDAISFVGSTPIARHVYETGTAHGKRVQALGGAKNHMLVLPDADLDLAADSAVSAGFGSAGERCMAISVVVAVGDIADELVAKIHNRTARLVTGDGRRGCDMGPVVSAEAKARITRFIDEGEKAGAVLVADGRAIEPEGSSQGYFVGPTLFDHVSTEMSIYRDEIFGPVLSVIRVADYEAGMELINSSHFGNGAAVFTRDGQRARRFTREAQVGMVGVNVPVPVPVAYYSFGGWKASLFGDTRAHGMEGVRFFTRTKAVTQRWPESASSGLELAFPQND